MLRVENLAGIRGVEKLFQDISFDLLPGQLTWLRGANGSGKTTMLRMLAGIAAPVVGKIYWDGETLSKSNSYKQQLVYLGHSNGLKDDLTATESLRFLAQFHNRDDNIAVIENALKRMGMFHRRHLPVRMLSQGQRKRVALARLVLESRPGVWVLDEPFDSLDDQGVATVTGLLEAHLENGGCVILTSHISIPIERVALQVIDLDKRLVA